MDAPSASLFLLRWELFPLPFLSGRPVSPWTYKDAGQHVAIVASEINSWPKINNYCVEQQQITIYVRDTLAGTSMNMFSCAHASSRNISPTVCAVLARGCRATWSPRRSLTEEGRLTPWACHDALVMTWQMQRKAGQRFRPRRHAEH